MSAEQIAASLLKLPPAERAAFANCFYEHEDELPGNEKTPDLFRALCQCPLHSPAALHPLRNFPPCNGCGSLGDCRASRRTPSSLVARTSAQTWGIILIRSPSMIPVIGMPDGRGVRQTGLAVDFHRVLNSWHGAGAPVGMSLDPHIDALRPDRVANNPN